MLKIKLGTICHSERSRRISSLCIYKREKRFFDCAQDDRYYQESRYQVISKLYLINH